MITGASSGLGEEFARQLAPVARRLILVARRLDRLETLRAELMAGHAGLDILTYGIDLAVEEAIEPMLLWLQENQVQIDLLINNAGLGDYGPFETSDWGRVRQMIEVNITALTLLTHRLLPMLRAAGTGVVLNVGSVAGMIPVPFETVYAATKAYVASFSEGLRAELRGTGVRVTNVCPGPVNTEFSKVAAREPHGLLASPDFLKVSPGQVVAAALRAAAADRARVIPGWQVALLLGIAAALPMWILRMVFHRLSVRKNFSGTDPNSNNV